MHDLVTTSYAHVLRAACLFAPGNPRLVRRRSRLLRRRGDLTGALALVEHALGIMPEEHCLLRERLRVTGELAKARWAEGDAQGALDLIQQALVAAPRDQLLVRERLRLTRALVKARWAEGDAQGALTLIDRALTDTPRDPWLLAEYRRMVARVAKARSKAGDADGALRLIDEAIARTGDLSELMAVRAAMLYGAARYQDALGSWRQLADRDPVDARCWVGMAKALYAMDQLEQTEQVIDEYLRALGERPGRYARAAQVALAGHRAARFEALLARAQAQADTNDEGRLELATLHFAVGRIGEAFNCLHNLPALPAAVADRQRKALHALRVVGIDAKSMSAAERVELRMPDLVLLTMIRYAPKPRSGTAGNIVMVYTSLGPGGAERQLMNTVGGLHSLGIERKIVLMRTKDRDFEVDRFHGAGLESLPVTVEPCAGGEAEPTLLRAALGANAADLLGLLPAGLRQEVSILTTRFLRTGPHVVHAWSDHRSIAAGVAAALAGVPRIVLSGRTIASPDLRPVPGYFRTVYRALLNRPGTILLNNSEVGAQTYVEWLGIEPSRIRVIYNGVDVEALEGARDAQATAAHRARLGIPADAGVVGTAFRLERVKRPQLWVQAAAEVARREPRAHFVIVGDGPLRAQVQSLARELGIADRLHMPGLTRDVVPWFELMDVVLLTSEREGTSNTALEAQALGKPVVSTAVGGMPETFLPDLSGFLVEPDPAPEAVAASVMRVLRDNDWRNQARPAAQAFIRERFSLERMVGDTLQVYDLPS